MRPGRTVGGEDETAQHAGDLRQIAHEDRRQIDHRSAAGALRDDRQAEQDAVGVGEIDGLFGGRSLVRAETNVAADDLNAVIDLAELPNPIVAAAAQGHAAQQRSFGDAAGHGDGHDEILVQIAGRQLGKQLVFLAIELDEPFDALGIAQHFAKRRKFRLGLCRLTPPGRLAAAGCREWPRR